MNLLLLISGNKKIILDKHGYSQDDFDAIKIDEKDLSKFGKIRSFVRATKYDEIWFGSLDLDYQRFFFFICLFILFSHNHKGGLIDESGRKVEFKLSDFIFLQTPKFIAETIFSLLVVCYFYIKFPILRWMSSRNH